MAFTIGESFSDAISGERSVDEAVIDYTIELCAAAHDAMEAKGVTKAELARRMGKKPSQVSRMMSGTAHNMTLRTIAEIDVALGLGLSLLAPARGARGFIESSEAWAAATASDGDGEWMAANERLSGAAPRPDLFVVTGGKAA